MIFGAEMSSEVVHVVIHSRRIGGSTWILVEPFEQRSAEKAKRFRPGGADD
jgi:hypothetical protein